MPHPIPVAVYDTKPSTDNVDTSQPPAINDVIALNDRAHQSGGLGGVAPRLLGRRKVERQPLILSTYRSSRDLPRKHEFVCSMSTKECLRDNARWRRASFPPSRWSGPWRATERC